MKFRILSLTSASVFALVLAQCKKDETPKAAAAEAAKPEAATKAEPGLKLPTAAEGLSPHFMAVASKLEIGRTSFMYAEQEDTLVLLAELLDGAIKAMPEEQKKDMPPNFSVREVLSILGLDRVKAVGGSSRSLADGRYHSRSFAYIPDGRKGWLTLSGGPAEPFLFRELAPADADLIVEFPLHTKDFAKDAFKSAASWMPQKERAEFEAQINQKLPPLGLSIREIAEKLGARAALIARLNPDQQLPAGGSGLTMPGADVALVVERLGWLLEPLKQQMMPMISSPEAPVEMTDKDGILTVRFRAPMGPAPMDFQPCLWFDSKKNRLIVTSRPAYLDALLKPDAKLAGAAGFKQAWEGMPQDGNGCLYLSPRLLGTAVDAVRQSLSTPE
ncbi:MAG TPA: hypothetical protein VD994_20480, partial [Prosthecobacter sp.]|nr:hypothetical protein [Prosthecobacter sp.]